jgi:3-phenylpropionate/trans-cinnamate dioxygenase ferredoxin reductase subunit
MSRVVIVGASLGGLRAAEALRGLGYLGAITIVGAEAHMPYNRPPLSKDVLLGDLSPAETLGGLAFRPKANLSDVIWRLGVGATGSDLAAGRVRLSDGDELGFDALIAATGLRPRRLPLVGGGSSRFVLRHFEDAMALRLRLVPGTRVAVVGGGFIGCEVAASAIRRGCAVTVIEPESVPMQRALGVDLGKALQAVHEDAGVAFRLGRKVMALDLTDNDRLRGVHLDDGTHVATDLMVEAIGSLPNTAWLEGNGLDLADGVLCDDRLSVVGHAQAAAVGDVARFPNPLFDEIQRRIEHWSVPGITARRAAEHVARLLGVAVAEKPFAFLPTFWSDQLGLRIQSAGMPGLADRTEILSGSLDPRVLRREGVVMGYWQRERQVGIAAVAVPPQHFARLQVDLTKSLQFVSV